MRRLIAQVAVAFVALELLYLVVLWYRESSVYVPVSAGELMHSPMAVKMRSFLESIGDLHPSKGAGTVAPLINYKLNMEDDYGRFGDEHTTLSIDLLSQYLYVDQESRDILREQHAEVLHRIHKLPSGAVGGRGIVLTGGGSYFGQTLVTIRYFLGYHPGYPIELWMARSEYEPYYCENIFPKNNVTCMIVEDFFGSTIEGFDYMGYPLKSLALAGSQFAEIYFTDVDSFPLRPLSEIFNSKPFKKTGFISWPDYWVRVTSPDFYEVAGKINLSTVNTSLEMSALPGCVPETLSSETGQIVFDKKRHYDTLLLSAYYNLNGKDYYYPLLSQNKHVPGFGDKETFISAAYVLDHEAYQVNTSVLTLGYFQENDAGFHGSGILQSSPMDDYAKYALGEKLESIDPWSLHSTTMKLDPFYVFSDLDEEHWNKPNQYIRPCRWLGPKSSVESRIGYDLETRLYEVITGVLCDWVLEKQPNFVNEENPKRTCERARHHLEWLKANTGDH